MSKSNYYLLIFSAIALVVGLRLELLELYALQTPYWDDWRVGAFLNKTHVSGLEFSDLFRSANEHRMMFNRIWSLALFELNHQQWDPIVWMISNAIIWAISGAVLIGIVQNNAPAASRVALTMFIVLLWAFPFAMVNILWGVQTHTYTMILFSVLGCWWSTDQVFSLKWCFGILCLTAATFTLAGGTFASAAVIGVSLMSFLATRKSPLKATFLVTAAAAAVPAIIGLSLIAKLPNHSSQELILGDAVTTFLKTMSWPEVTGLYYAFVFAVPIIVLIVQVFRHGAAPSRFTRLVLSLFAFTVIVALAVAYARGHGGPSPARRYFEFLSLIPLSSLMAIGVISTGIYRINATAIATMLALFIAAFFAGMPLQINAIDYTLKEKAVLAPIQTQITSRYLNTQDPEELLGHPYRHVPFPRVNTLQDILDEMSKADTLPSSLQPQPDLQWNPERLEADRVESPFIRNGTPIEIDGIIGSDHFGEPAYGSYNPDKGGEAAVGSFASATVRITRSFAEISYMGDINGPGMSLLLEDVGSGTKYPIVPTIYKPRYSGRHSPTTWASAFVKIPRGYYRIVAQDNSEVSWLAFGSPRSVGRLSFYSQKLMSYGHWIWKIALFLLLISMRESLINLLSSRQKSI
jgi:hypothetical protein